MIRARLWGYALAQRREAAVRWLVWHLPRELVYWATIRLFAHATTGRWGDQTPDSVTIWTALQRWERGSAPRRARRDPDPAAGA